MFAVVRGWAVPSGLQGLRVVNEGPHLAIHMTGASDFRDRVGRSQGGLGKDAVQLDPGIMQDVRDSFQLLPCSQAILLDCVQSSGPWSGAWGFQLGGIPPC